MKNSSFCRNCSYDDNNDVKNNKSFDDHADNPDNAVSGIYINKNL